MDFSQVFRITAQKGLSLMLKLTSNKFIRIAALLLILLQAMVATSVQAAPTTWPTEAAWPNTSSSDTYAYKMINESGNLVPVRDINGDQNPDATDVSSHGNNRAIGDWN